MAQHDEPDQHDIPRPSEVSTAALAVPEGEPLVAEEPRRNLAYEDLGIFPDTYACVAVMTTDDAKDYTFSLAQAGVGVRVARDPDGKRWHVATPGGLGYSPVAWLLTIRDAKPATCRQATAVHGQHPMVELTGELE